MVFNVSQTGRTRSPISSFVRSGASGLHSLTRLFSRLVSGRGSSSKSYAFQATDLTRLASGKYEAVLLCLKESLDKLGDKIPQLNDESLIRAVIILKSDHLISEQPRESFKVFHRLLKDAATRRDSLNLNDQEVVRQLCSDRLFGADFSVYDEKCRRAANIKENTGFSSSESSNRVSLKGYAREFERRNKVFNTKLRTINQFIGTMLQRWRGDRGNTDFLERNPPNLRGSQTFSFGRLMVVRYGRPTQNARQPRGTGFRGCLGYSYQERGHKFLPIPQEINPEYEAALEHAKGENKGVLYVVHQKAGGHGSESAASELIFELERNHENFSCLHQSVEGKYFEKELQKENLSPSAFQVGCRSRGSIPAIERQASSKPEEIYHLVAEFMDQFEEGGSNRLPLKLQKDENYKKELAEILNLSMSILFKNKSVKTKEERQSFILLAYVLQKEHLKKYLSIDRERSPKQYPIGIYSAVCKDDLDRGGNMQMVETLLQIALVEGKTEKEKEILLSKNIDATTTPAYKCRKTGALDYRVAPGLIVANHLSKMDDDELSKLRQVLQDDNILVKDLSLNGNQSEE